MSVSDEVHHLVDQLDDAGLQEALDYLRWLASDEETLSDEELELVRIGEEQLDRGEFITLEDFRRSLSE